MQVVEGGKPLQVVENSVPVMILVGLVMEELGAGFYYRYRYQTVKTLSKYGLATSRNFHDHYLCHQNISNYLVHQRVCANRILLQKSSKLKVSVTHYRTPDTRASVGIIVVLSLFLPCDHFF